MIIKENTWIDCLIIHPDGTPTLILKNGDEIEFERIEQVNEFKLKMEMIYQNYLKLIEIRENI